MGLAALLALVAMTTPALAVDRIWTGLVLATTEEPAKPPPEDLAQFAAGLEEVFGYNSFYLLKAKRQKIVEGTEEWIVPSRKLFLRVRCVSQTATAYMVEVELYFDGKLLLTSDVSLARNAPLYIRGPQWGKGRLIFILEVR